GSRQHNQTKASIKQVHGGAEPAAGLLNQQGPALSGGGESAQLVVRAGGTGGETGDNGLVPPGKEPHHRKEGEQTQSAQQQQIGNAAPAYRPFGQQKGQAPALEGVMDAAGGVAQLSHVAAQGEGAHQKQ